MAMWPAGLPRRMSVPVLVVALLLPLLHVLPVADAGIVPRSDLYLHRLNGAPADPVNLIFAGGDTNAAAAAVQRVLGWRPASGSELLFWQEAEPALSSRQLALDLGHGSRFHIRIEQAYQPNPRGEVLAGVHLDIR